eukprot:5564620-Lingulodinium_polyedra.AAC.1
MASSMRRPHPSCSQGRNSYAAAACVFCKQVLRAHTRQDTSTALQAHDTRPTALGSTSTWSTTMTAFCQEHAWDTQRSTA